MNLTTFLKNCGICGRTYTQLKKILTHQSENYKILSPGVISIENKQTGDVQILKCISEYYSVDGKKVKVNKNRSPYIKCCIVSKDILKKDFSETSSCAICHLECIDRLEKGEIKRL